MPKIVAKIIAPIASSTVAGKRLSSSVTASRRRRARAQVELADDVLRVAPVLDVDRVVEAELLSDLGNRLLVSPLAEQCLGGRSGKGPDPHEDEDREPDQDRMRQEPADVKRDQVVVRRLSISVSSFRYSDGDGSMTPARPGWARSSGRPQREGLDVHVRHAGEEVHDHAAGLPAECRVLPRRSLSQPP
jgi:hypothetical protein